MADIYRGTTPTIECTVDMDLTDYSCYLSIGRDEGKPWCTADNTQMTMSVDKGSEPPVSTVQFTLTQKQTLDCKTGKASVQLRAIKDDTALATDWCPITVGGIIKGGVIADEYDSD